MRRPLAAAAAVFVLASSALLARDGKKHEKSVAFKPDTQKIDFKVDDKVTIESVRIRRWPDGDDFRKAEKELNDKHMSFVEFTYSNRDLDRDYKCRYEITVTGPSGTLFHDDHTATLDKGKVDDTNKMMMRMRTNDYKAAKQMKVSFEVWPK